MEDNITEKMGYEQICNTFRQLTDVRFKLLAFVPSVSGTAIALISVNLVEFEKSPLPRIIVALLGLFVTLGIIIYDQRNSQIYNSLISTGKELEKTRNIKGPFSLRPGRSLKFFNIFLIWHDRGLAFIYGSVLGAWLFPIICGLLWLLPKPLFLQSINFPSVPIIAGWLATAGGIGFIFELHRLDRVADQKKNESTAGSENRSELYLQRVAF